MNDRKNKEMVGEISVNVLVLITNKNFMIIRPLLVVLETNCISFIPQYT